MCSPAVYKHFLFFVLTVLGKNHLFSVTHWLRKIETVNQMKVNFEVRPMSEMGDRLTDL